MIHVLFLTRSLNTGGAQRQLGELARALDKNQFEVTVATFYPGGAVWEELRGIPTLRLVSLEKRGRWDGYRVWRAALKLVNETRVDVIYGFREAGNLLALPLARVSGAKVVWGIRRSTKALPVHDPFALGMFYLGALLSRAADKVIYNSSCGRNFHIGRGYCAPNANVIPNGFNTMRFQPDAEAREKQRCEWGMKGREVLLGIVGRLDPVKDHHLFLETAARVGRIHPDVRFVVVGGGSGKYLNVLQSKASTLGVADKFLWIGESENMLRVYNALDTVVLCSREEGCPNVVGEAMACGVPCVVTDVGDTATMVGDTGIVVAPGDLEAMVAAWIEQLRRLAKNWHEMGLSARNRITQEYSLEKMVERTSTLLEKTVLFEDA